MPYEHESETAERQEHSKSDRVEFRPPKDFTVPEGTEAKGEFDLVCSFRVKPDGMICLTMLGDTKMPGYDGKEEEAEETKSRPDYKQYAQSMTDEMGAPNPQSY